METFASFLTSNHFQGSWCADIVAYAAYALHFKMVMQGPALDRIVVGPTPGVTSYSIKANVAVYATRYFKLVQNLALIRTLLIA